MVRLHEALKQCQDLKTEKGQMDRKINQLSEENGDLSFKVRGAESSPCPRSPVVCGENSTAVLDAGPLRALASCDLDLVTEPALGSGS